MRAMNHYDRHAAVGTRFFWCPLQYQAVIGDCPTSIEEVGHMSDTELLPKPKREPEPVRRLEVFTGVGRRRRWTAEQKARIVAERYESGETVCAVARRHGLTPQQLFGWRRHTRLAEDGDGKGGIAFAPVIVEAARPYGNAPIAAACTACQRCAARALGIR